MWGLGQVGYSDYMGACTGGGSASCSPFDQVCIANATNIVNACQEQYVSDPTSPHNDPNANTLPSQLTAASPQYDTELAGAGGSVQLVEQANNEPLPPDTTSGAWWGAPGATVAPAAIPTPASSSPTVVSPNTYVSSAPPVSSPASSLNTYVSSTPPASTSATSSAAVSGLDLSAIPWWGWVLGAGVAVFAFSKA